MKKPQATTETPPLATWNSLNEWLRDAGEADCEQLLEEERAGKARPTFIRRIHSRLNKVRADRERRELVDGLR